MRIFAWVLITIWLQPLPVRAQGGPLELVDIDRFMEKVLENRARNWADLQEFVFREEETLDLKGSEIASAESFQRNYIWFYREGKLRRKLVEVDGAKLSAESQEETVFDPKSKKGREGIPRENFFNFEFEPGNYLVSGRERFAGREVVLVEYYPQKLFDELQDSEDRDEREFGKAFEKTTRVKIWIAPEQYQIVRMAFENVGLDFLPYRWLVRVDEIRAEIIMDQPISDLWLPLKIEASGKVSTALFDLTLRYERSFSDYQEAEVKVRLQYEEP